MILLQAAVMGVQAPQHEHVHVSPVACLSLKQHVPPSWRNAGYISKWLCKEHTELLAVKVTWPTATLNNTSMPEPAIFPHFITAQFRDYCTWEAECGFSLCYMGFGRTANRVLLWQLCHKISCTICIRKTMKIQKGRRVGFIYIVTEISRPQRTFRIPTMPELATLPSELHLWSFLGLLKMAGTGREGAKVTRTESVPQTAFLPQLCPGKNTWVQSLHASWKHKLS